MLNSQQQDFVRLHSGFPLKLALLLALFLSVAVQAQFTTASLSGTVNDPTGAVVPGASLTLRNVATGLEFTTTSDGNGAYLFTRVPIGKYNLTVESAGFNTYLQSGITLAVNQMATQNVRLELGQVAEQITVEANTEIVNTRTATAGQLVDEKRIVELPLQGRRPERLVYLAAGTVDLGRNACRICGHGGVYPGEETAGVNGAGMGQVNYQLDATGHNDTYLNTSLPFPNPDSVQEFNLQSSNFTAEFGNAAGGIVNIVTKSGTNDIHGALFHFIRNGALNARQFFAPEQDALKRNQFGGSVGGPIVKDKLFYFGTYQGTVVRNVPSGRIQFVPTAQERAGDFSSVSKQLVDPVSHDALMNNQIPATRFSPVSQFFLKRIPLPNGANRQLTFPGTPIQQDETQFMGKADYTAGKHTISGRYYFTDFDAPPLVGPDNILAASSAGNAVRVQNVSLNHTYTFSPTFLLNSTFGLNRQRGGSLSSADFGLADAGAKVIGPESVSELASPPELVVGVTDGFSISTNHLGAFDRGDTTFREVATKISGPHEIRFGGEAVRVWNHIINTFQMAGQSTFNGQLSGNGLSDFMFGRLSQYRQGGGEFKDLVGVKWGFFVQDNWRVTPRLNLNLGLRWDPFLPYYDRKGRVVCYSPNFTQRSKRFPNAPLGFLYGGEDADPGCPQAGYENTWANIGPRVGIAYRLSEDGKTSLRAGGGIYYTPIQSSEMNPFTNTAPFAGTFTLNDVAFEDPFGSAGQANPFPNNFGNVLRGPDFVFAPINDIRRYFAPDFRVVQLATWTVRLERQVATDAVLSVAYLGNSGSHLLASPQENFGIYIPGVDANGQPLSTVGNLQQRRVNPTFGSVNRADSGANSSYHSLQFNFEKRFSKGYSILTNYAWSKTLDNLDSHPLDRRSRWGLATEDIAHNFKFSNIYDVPGLRDNHGWAKLVNGWQLNSIAVWQSGFPFSVSSGRDNSFTGSGSDLADFKGGVADLSSDRSHGEQVLQWFDTSLFTANAVGTFGNSGRNILRGPRFFNLDFGLVKNTAITERVNLQFRTEFFNLFNNVNLRLPNSNASSSQIGRITSVVDDSQRIIQFGLKLVF